MIKSNIRMEMGQSLAVVQLLEIPNLLMFNEH